MFPRPRIVTYPGTITRGGIIPPPGTIPHGGTESGPLPKNAARRARAGRTCPFTEKCARRTVRETGATMKSKAIFAAGLLVHAFAAWRATRFYRAHPRG